MKFAFLELTLAVIAFPLILHFTAKIFSGSGLKVALGASLITSIVMSSVTAILQVLGVLIYDYSDTSSLLFRSLPVEQYLLHFGFCFATIGVYQYLNIKFPNNYWQKYSLSVSHLLIGLSIAFLFFAYDKWYTIVTFSVLIVTLLLIEYVGQLRFMYKAYRAFLVMLALFYAVYGFLFAIGVFKVNVKEVAGLYVLKIPIETHFTTLCCALIGVYMFEFFKVEKEN